MTEKYIIEALERGLYVLSQFDENHTSLTLTALVNRTGINKATMYRILTTLENAGYLERDPETRQYRPSVKVLRLGFAALSSLDLRQIAHPYLQKLADSHQLTASLGILDDLNVVHVDSVRNRETVGVMVGLGTHIPAHCAAMGKAMLAFFPEAGLEARLENVTLTPCTPQTQSTVDDLQRELQKVREDGVAFNIDELAIGLRAVAAPIRDRSGQAVAAIDVSGNSAILSVERLRDELAPEIKKIARQISGLLIQ